MRAAWLIAEVPRMSIFLGTQPRKAQVPPNGRNSATATVQPAARTRLATPIGAMPSQIRTQVVFSVHRTSCCIGAGQGLRLADATLDQREQQAVASAWIGGHLRVP